MPSILNLLLIIIVTITGNIIRLVFYTAKIVIILILIFLLFKTITGA